MATLGMRIAVLEKVQGKQGLFRNPEMNALMADVWAKSGTSYVKELAHYGSEHALLKALGAQLQSIQSTRKEICRGNT